MHRRGTTPGGTLAIAAVVLATAACGGGEGRSDGGEAPPDSSVPGAMPGEEVVALPIGLETRVTGFVTLDGRRGTLVACGSGAEYRVEGPGVYDLLVLHDELVIDREPDQPMYVDVLVEVGPPPTDTRGSEWAGTLDVLEVHRAAFEGWTCVDATEGVLAEARGNEPFWRLLVTADSTSFATPEGNRKWDLGSPPVPSPEGWRLTGTTEAGSPFVLTLGEGGCFDSMSGAWSRLEATLTVGDEAQWGCGWLGEDAAGRD